MPYRYFLVILIALLLGYFSWMTYKDAEPDPWIMVTLTGLVVSSLVFQHQINNWWWSCFPIDLDEREKAWIAGHLPYFRSIPEKFRGEFFRELAKKCQNQEFISMGLSKMHEEWKWLSLGPAIALRLYKNPEVNEHYIRTAIYPHPFISPEISSVHISETHFEDGIMILSLENLHKSHENPRRWLNPALYEWCRIALRASDLRIGADTESVEHLVSAYLGATDFREIEEWMGLYGLDHEALLVYLYIMDQAYLSQNEPGWTSVLDGYFSWTS